MLYPLRSYFVSSLTPLQVDFVSYMDELAGEIGVRPSLLWLLFTDYPLFKKVLWGPVSAYQYRLMGPGKWDGARRAIFTQFDRMYQPLKTRQVWCELCETCTECLLCAAWWESECPTIWPNIHVTFYLLSITGGGGRGLHHWPTV